MPDKPILFSAPMIRALIEGRKTQTRRVVKDRGVLPEFCGGRYDDKNDPEAWGWEDCDRGEWITLDQWRRWNFVPYRVGDRLWVRETWRPSISAADPWHVAVLYDADKRVKHWGWSSDADFGDWNLPKQAANGNVPSIHMPRWASRLTLVVTDVRVQRLQEINEAGAKAEGCGDYTIQPGTGVAWNCRVDFMRRWNSLHGPGAWDANPWVVTLTFDVHKRNIDEMETLK